MFFDASTTTDTLKSFQPLPRDKYLMTVEDVEPAEDRFDNEYIKLVLTVTEGPFKGRKLFQNLYLNHPEWDKVVSRSRATLKALCEIGNTGPLKTSSDLEKLVGVVSLVEVAIYKDRNIINTITEPTTSPKVELTSLEDVPF